MNFSKLNTTLLRQVLKLSERKETLLHELAKIENEIFAQLHSHSSATGTTIKNEDGNNLRTGKRLGKGMMKQNVLEALKEAGEAGLRIPELSKKIDATSGSLHVWFTNVGKKLSEIEKIGAGHFRIRQ